MTTDTDYGRAAEAVIQRFRALDPVFAQEVRLTLTGARNRADAEMTATLYQLDSLRSEFDAVSVPDTFRTSHALVAAAMSEYRSGVVMALRSMRSQRVADAEKGVQHIEDAIRQFDRASARFSKKIRDSQQ
jgi:hypothetical protein